MKIKRLTRTVTTTEMVPVTKKVKQKNGCTIKLTDREMKLIGCYFGQLSPGEFISGVDRSLHWNKAEDRLNVVEANSVLIGFYKLITGGN